MFSLEERKVTGDITVFTYMKDCCREEGNLFSMSVVEETGSCRLKLQGGILALDVRERKPTVVQH